MNNNDESSFLSIKNHAQCDIVLNSIIDSKWERIEQIEITTVRDVYEEIVWESELKKTPSTYTKKKKKKKKLASPFVMDIGDKVTTENLVQGSSLSVQNGGDNKNDGTTATHDVVVDGVFNSDNTTDLLNTSEASIYYEIENDDGSESAQISTNQDSSFYPRLDEVKQVEADINDQYTVTENTISKVRKPENEYIGNDSKNAENHNSKDAKVNEATISGDEGANYSNDQGSNDKKISFSNSSSSNKMDLDDNSSSHVTTDRPRHMSNSISNNHILSRSASTASSVILKGYPHDRDNQFSKLTRKYFKYIHRYHIGDTLSNYFRGQFQMQMRAIGANYLTVGLFGQAGSGKSAFLNSLYSAMNGTYVEYSPERRTGADSETEPGATNRRVELRLTETIVVLDNRATDFSKSSVSEIVKQCGKLYSYTFIGFLILKKNNTSLSTKRGFFPKMANSLNWKTYLTDLDRSTF